MCCLFLQHEAGRAAFEDAQKQMENILGASKTKTASISNIQNNLEKSKLEVLGAHKAEQVCVFIPTFEIEAIQFIYLCNYRIFMRTLL